MHDVLVHLEKNFLWNGRPKPMLPMTQAEITASFADVQASMKAIGQACKASTDELSMRNARVVLAKSTFSIN